MRDGMAPVYSVAETMLFSSSRMLICLLRSVMGSLLTQVGCPAERILCIWSVWVVWII